MRNWQKDLLPNARISVVFISNPPFEPQIKGHGEPFSIEEKEDKLTEPFQEIAPPPIAAEPTSTLKAMRSPQPDRFKAALISSKRESNLFDASLRALNHRIPANNSMPELKLVEFSLELPGAKIVQLAADFTDWEESPIDMVRFDDGVWSTTVPLPAGIYSYRFLVDGQWHDDPRAVPSNQGMPKAFIRIK